MRSLADAVVAYLRRRERLLVRLARVNAAISCRNEWDANAYMPGDLQRNLPQSALSHEALDGLHRMLAEELGRLDGWTDRERRTGSRTAPSRPCWACSLAIPARC